MTTLLDVQGRRTVGYLVNKSGGAVVKGDVVIVDASNDEAFTTSTTGAEIVAVGVVAEENGIASNASGRIVFAGYVDLITVSSSVTRGHFGKTHTVAKQSVDAGTSRVVGVFCQYLKSGTTPSAWLFGLPDGSTGSAGLVGGTPALTFGTANSAGSASSAVRTDATLAIFDTTAPVTQAFADVAAVGSAGVAARRDHKHGMPSGGLTTDTYGTTTDGGTSDNPGARKMAAKKITVTTAGQLVSIRGFVKGDAAHAGSLAAFLLDDNAGVPGKVIAGGAFLEGGQVLLSATVRAIDIGVSYPVTATSYWIAWWWFDSAGAMALRYVATGPDYTQAASGTWALDGGVGTGYAAASRDYSLSAKVIR